MLKLIEIVDSRLYQNPSLSRVGEELAAHEADNPPFLANILSAVVRKDYAFRLNGIGPAYLTTRKLVPFADQRRITHSREPVSETTPWLRLDVILSNLAGRLLCVHRSTN